MLTPKTVDAYFKRSRYWGMFLVLACLGFWVWNPLPQFVFFIIFFPICLLTPWVASGFNTDVRKAMVAKNKELFGLGSKKPYFFYMVGFITAAVVISQVVINYTNEERHLYLFLAILGAIGLLLEPWLRAKMDFFIADNFD